MPDYFFGNNDANLRRALAQTGANMTRRQGIRQLGGPQVMNPNLWAQGNGQLYRPAQQLDLAPRPLPAPAQPYGMGYTDGPEIDARIGAVPGRQIVIRSASQQVNSDTPAGTAILAESAFTQNDQNRLGSGRRLEGIIASIVVSGTFPSGYDAAQLEKAAQSALVLQIKVQDQLQDEIPFDAALDTGFTQRMLQTNIRFDSGAFGAVKFVFTSGSDVMPAPASSLYTVSLRAKCIFSPLSRRQRAMSQQY